MLKVGGNQPLLAFQQDMELINILYMQDIDIGVGREAYDAGFRLDNNCTDDQTKISQEQTNESDNNSDNNEINQQTSEFPQVDLTAQYTVDNETGELIWCPSTAPEVGGLEYSQLQHQLNNATLDVPDTPQIELLHLSLLNNNTDQSVAQQPIMNYERQSSFDQQWNDLLSVLSTPSDVPDFMMDVSAGNIQYNGNAAIVQNASMCSAAEPAVDDTGAMQPNYSLPFPSSSSNYLIQSFDNSTMSFLINGSVDAGVHQFSSVSNISHPAYGTDQPNHGLFGNLSILPLMSLESGEPELYGGMQMNYAIGVPNANFSGPRDGLESDMTYNQMADQSASAVSASVSEIGGNNVQDILQLLQSDLADDLDLIDLMDEDEIVSSSTNQFDNLVNEEGWSSDSAVSSMESPMQQSYNNSLNDSEEVSGASGGLPKYNAYRAKSESFNSEYYERSFPFSYEQKLNGSSNFTDINSSTASNNKNVHHNHTYPLPIGRKSRDELEEEARREKEERATRSRDEKRAKAMKIPLTMDEMIDSSVEQFTELLTHHRLNEAQQQLVRDIRRRGKNKMAAQNCRKRKMEVIQTIDEQVSELRERRDALLRERGELDRNAAALKDKFKRLETELFRRLHDESGREYDPSLFSLLQTDDGGLFIVPRNNTSNDCSTTSDKSHDEKNGRKRKSKRKD